MFTVRSTDTKAITLLIDRMKDTRPLLQKIGFDAQMFCAQSFTRQGLYRKNAWPERFVPNLAGIFSDANKPGGEIKTRRLDSAPALKDTGVLSRSISYKIKSDSKVFIGTNVAYAKVHNEGGYSEQKRTNYETFDKKIDKFVRTKMRNYGEETKGLVLSLKHADSFGTKVRKRQFLGYPAKRGNKLIKEHILGNP